MIKTFQIGDSSFPNKVYLFNGYENVMSLKRAYTITWICKFNMIWYPFDTQTCSMEFFYLLNDLVIFLPGNLSYIGPKELPEYMVQSTKICSSTIRAKPGVRVKIIFGRNSFSIILTVFMPTLILVVISHKVNRFEENYLDMVISVNLTVLLVLATL